MNRGAFIHHLKALWKHDGNELRELTIADLLDDAATVGLPDASVVYCHYLLCGLDKKGF